MVLSVSPVIWTASGVQGQVPRVLVRGRINPLRGYRCVVPSCYLPLLYLVERGGFAVRSEPGHCVPHVPDGPDNSNLGSWHYSKEAQWDIQPGKEGEQAVITVRLSREMEQEIDQLARHRNMTRSQLVKEVLTDYVRIQYEQMTPFELGIDLFGAGNDGDSDLSMTHKEKLRDQLNAKHAH